MSADVEINATAAPAEITEREVPSVDEAAYPERPYSEARIPEEVEQG